MALDPSSPYLAVSAESRWRDAVSKLDPGEIDPHLASPFRLDPADRIASAGSCFAQRISEALQAAGYNYMLLEKGPPFLAAAERRALGYSVYSARFGNVYTTRQLLQLFRRGFARFEPEEKLWRNAEGRFVDPFRPAIQPHGFASESECLWDRQSHLAAVRRMFQELDVFVFTLGLTECWVAAADGAAFPVCPGSGLGGTYDPARHVFRNLTVADVTADLDMFLGELKQINPGAKVILTVSPVPLVATFEPRHVLQATTYSKSVLRVACEEIRRRHDHVHYFASYEIVTALGDGSYFLPDRRTVSPEAVDHVIECFRRQFMASDQPRMKQGLVRATPPAGLPVFEQPMCDEDGVLAALAASAANEITGRQ